jgi:hypothetical protein
MSNKNLKNAIYLKISDYKAGCVSLLNLLETVEKAVSAIEAIPYSLVSELRSITQGIKVAQDFEEDGFVSKADSEIARLKECLLLVPD